MAGVTKVNGIGHTHDTQYSVAQLVGLELDALVDILVVTIGAIRAAGWDGAGAWEEVMRTNFAKIDPETGKVRKREDGKVLKPEGWEAPKLEKFLGKKN